MSIIEKINQARQGEASSPWETLSIYRVPNASVTLIRSLTPLRLSPSAPTTADAAAFAPWIHKWRSLYHALDRTGRDVRLYLDAARFLEDRARSCYEAPISMSSDAFVESLVLDSIFALELFRGVAREGFRGLGYSPNDPVFAVRGIMHSLQRNMIMLENQLPLFVLDWILTLQLGYEPSGSYLVAPLSLRFFNPLMPTDELLRPTASSGPLYEVDSGGALHCIDVFRHNLLPCPTPASIPRLTCRGKQSARPFAAACPTPFSDAWWLPITNKRRWQLIHRVVDLRDAGIKFRRRTGVRFWDIEFKDGVLYIPCLLIHDGTKSLFLNLIVFEQCHLECDNHITSYLTFMDNLINSDVDVRYLHANEIIEHWLGSDGEVAVMFNRLCQEVMFDRHDCYLSELLEQVRYYNNKWNTWRASFNHKYFSNPLAFISLIAVVVLLLLIAAHTVYTVYPYYKPK
ncbi:UPF0481 protein [Dendrobium catenatum]|uniref:UPF0481 protein n=1 Tax=Dendrobium catenatum TaxID=906689 RepID=A0A2I0W536_9ASPA|nr:UPF0481 protein [Dendrobium catenatum]